MFSLREGEGEGGYSSHLGLIRCPEDSSEGQQYHMMTINVRTNNI
jgi:hypothetical protein